MTYCTNCGTQILEGQNFCASCGAPVSDGAPESQQTGAQPAPASDGAVMQPGSDATLQKLAALKAPALPPAKSSGKKLLIAVLVVFVIGAIAAVAGVVYVGYRVKQKASAALDNLEGEPGAHKATSDGDPGGAGGAGGASKSNPGNKDGGSSGGDAGDPLAAMLGKLQGGDGGTTPAGNMAKSILEDLGAKNSEMPPDLVRNISWAALQDPLPCPAGEQIDPAKLAAGRILFKPCTVITYSWSLPLADAESDEIIRSFSPPL